MRDELSGTESAKFTIEQLGQCLVENSSDAVIGVDGDGKILSWNSSAQTIYGYTASEIIGIKINILFCGDAQGEEWIAARNKLTPESPLRAWDVKQLRKDGTPIHLSIDMYPLYTRDGNPSGICVTAREDSKYKRFQSQARQTQKLEAVGRLSGGVAHDFNNLLTVISGYNSMIMLELAPDSDMWAWSQQVEKAAERATSLTNQLLAFSRREVTVARVLNLNDMVEDLDKMLSRIVGEDIRITLSLQADLVNIKADPGQISQLFTNLVVNSRDAMPAGGSLNIVTHNENLDTPLEAGEYQLAPGPYVTVTVEDTGTGMDAETMKHLFEPFFTTKPKGSGTGLGLSIVYGIVAQLRGDISVDSKPGEGTKFTIHLPATTEVPVELSAVRVQSPRAECAEIVVLLVEDDAAVRHLVRHMLMKLGYTVYETASQQEAIRICETVPVDVLLTDIVMPVMNGIDLAVKASSILPSLKVLYMSGYIDDTVLPSAYMDSGCQFIRKPFTAASLKDQIDAVLQHTVAVSARAGGH